MSTQTQPTLKQHCHAVLHQNKTPLAHLVNGIITFLIILSVAVVPVHFVETASWLQSVLFFFDRFTVTVFTFEYLLRIWSAEKPLHYVFSWWGLIDLIAILPFYLNRLGFLDSFMIFMAFRVLRVLKFSRMYGIEDVQSDLNSTTDKQKDHGGFKKMEEETVFDIVQQHPVIFLLRICIPIILISFGLTLILLTQGNLVAVGLAGLFFVLAGFFYFKAWLDFNYDVIIVTSHRVIVQDREIFGWKANDISYQAITNIFPDTMGFFNWFFKCGNVVIETAAMNGTLTFKYAQRPNTIVALISKNRQKIISAVGGGGEKLPAVPV